MNTAQAISLYGSENPYSDADARANSCYSGIVDGVLVRLLDWHKPDARLRMAHNAFQKVISEDSYPCLGAKSVVTKILDVFGFDTVDAGPLSESWRIQRDTPGYGPRRNAEELKKDLAAAKRPGH